MAQLGIPRRIWTYWDSGFDDAPEVVRLSYDSWSAMNPTWDLRALDASNVAVYVDIDELIGPRRDDLTVQKRSNLLRHELLCRFGGVWVDATTVCTVPLDDWVPDLGTPGLLMPRQEVGGDRLAANWFIAARPDSEILRTLRDVHLELMRARRFVAQGTWRQRWAERTIGRYARRGARQSAIWANPTVLAVVRAYPYFIAHYTLNRVVLADPRLSEQWTRMSTLPADGPRRLTRLDDVGDIAGALDHIDRSDTPFHKLDWRRDPSSDFWSAVLGHLRSRVEEWRPDVTDQPAPERGP